VDRKMLFLSVVEAKCPCAVTGCSIHMPNGIYQSHCSISVCRYPFDYFWGVEGACGV
jgi:hypothetical protein